MIQAPSQPGWLTKPYHRPTPIDPILEAVAAVFHVTVDAMRERGREQSVGEARQVVMYLARQRTGMSYAEIGRALKRDHTTILWGVESIAKRVRSDERLRVGVERVKIHLDKGDRR